MENEKKLLDWAVAEIAEPFGKIMKAAAYISKGESLTPAEAVVPIPLTNIDLDYRAIYPLLRDAMPVLAFEPAHLLVVAIDGEGKNVLSAALVKARDNNYVEATGLSNEGDWADLALDLIAEGDGDNLRHKLDEWFRMHHKQMINCVIVARPEALGALKDTWENCRSANADKGLKPLVPLGKAIGKSMDDGSLIMAATPRLFARVLDLYRIVDSGGAVAEESASDEAPFKLAIALYGRDYEASFLYDSSGKTNFGLNADIVKEAAPKGGERIKPGALVKALRKATGANYALVLDADMAINFLHELLNRPIPTETNDSKVQLKKLLYFIRGYKSLWWVYPVPVPLKNYVRVPMRLLGLPYDITRLSWWSLPDMIVDGIGMGLGDVARLAFITFEGGEPVKVMLVDLYNRGLKKIIYVDPAEVKPFFEGAQGDRKLMRAGLIKAKHYLWDNYGWVDYANAIDAEMLKLQRKLLFGGYLNSMLKIPLAAPTSVKLGKSVAKGGLVVYPDMGREAAADYLKHANRRRLRLNLIQIPFDAYRKRPRGPLYIRETIYLAGGAAALIAALFWIL